MKSSGFTLIELLIAIAIISILAMIAIPSYQEQVRKSRRAGAANALAQVQLLQERWRADRPTYATAAQSLTPAFGGIPATNHYTIAVTAGTAVAYQISATGTGIQTSDPYCATMTLSYNAGTGVITKGGTPGPAAKCW